MIVFLSSSILVSMDASFQLLLASKPVHLTSSGVRSYLTSGAVIIVEPPLFISVCLCLGEVGSAAPSRKSLLGFTLPFLPH